MKLVSTKQIILQWQWNAYVIVFCFLEILSTSGREVAKPEAGLDLTTYEIMTSAKTKSWTLNQQGHPGTLIVTLKIELTWTQNINSAYNQYGDPLALEYSDWISHLLLIVYLHRCHILATSYLFASWSTVN